VIRGADHRSVTPARHVIALRSQLAIHTKPSQSVRTPTMTVGR